MRIMQVDPAIKSAIMPCHFRLRVLGAMIGAFTNIHDKKAMNWEYFGHLNTYAGRELALPDNVEPGYDLWPPAIAALDYIVREIAPGEKIIDFACGMGALLAYLNYNGYRQVWGYDNWSQLPKSAAVEFLGNFELETKDDVELSDRLLGEPPVGFVTTFVFTGGHWKWFTQAQQEGLMPTLKTILVDSRYSPKGISGFEKVAIYGGLLNVFERSLSSPTGK